MAKSTKAIELQAQKKQEELEAKAVAYRDEVIEVSQKHGLEYVALLDFSNNGIAPVLRIQEIPKPPSPIVKP